MLRAEELGYDSLWTPDHVLPTPPTSDSEGRILEPFMCLSAVAARTSRATLGLLASPISLRHPTVMTKMITTLRLVSVHLEDNTVGNPVINLGPPSKVGVKASMYRADSM